MRQITILIFCLALANCSRVETPSDDNVQNNSNQVVSVSPTVKTNLPLKPVTPNVKFNSKQQSYLDKSLPPEVREILEKSEKFEVLAEVGKQNQSDGEEMTFEPNRIASVSDENDKKAILEAFYNDASKEVSPASCYLPHHGLRATYQDKTVEIEICFDCARFYVTGQFGKFNGTFVHENRKSDDVFNRIIENKSAEIKK